METATLSKTTVTENGSIVALPKNFEQLSMRKQKTLVVEAFRDNLIAINDVLQQTEQIKDASKTLAQRISLSKEGKELARMKKEIKQLGITSKELQSRRMGMLDITKKLGFDLGEELKKMKLIEAE